ncbi:unnamed protein product, partial [Allacma fusca]
LGYQGGFVPYMAKLLSTNDPDLEKKLNANIRKILPQYLDYEVSLRSGYSHSKNHGRVLRWG